ncbi:MAG: hypothetical protein IT250_10960 [Chitinophagaceae bacterium]|nr:hypothetical protein [Chitinophagaceae bacterium]
MNKVEGIDITILHLAKQENQDKDFDFYSLLTDLSIPADIHKFIFQTMFHRGYISGPPTISNPIVHITKPGLQYADQLKEQYFQKTGLPLDPTNSTNMELDQTCEILFQMHKNDKYSHFWTKSSYNGKPANLSVAKELLLSKRVLYSKSSSGLTSTHLNSDFYNTQTCKEALDIITEQSKPKPSVHIDNSITTHGDNSPAAGKELSFNQTNNPDAPKKKWYQKWVDEFIKNAVQFIFTILISFGGGLTIGKSCTPTKPQSNFQPSDPKSLQISSDTILNFKK